MHTQALSDRLLPTADAGLQATFSCVFQLISWLFPPYEQHIFVHDKSSLCFLSLTDLNIHKQRKTQASWVSATDSYGEKSLPALQLHLPQQWRHVQTTYYTVWQMDRFYFVFPFLFNIFTNLLTMSCTIWYSDSKICVNESVLSFKNYEGKLMPKRFACEG